ncbi:MAG: methyltransferase domain-containing protein [Gammaproteobacteria bacterium]|nr:methyltransferase domain-containing protein [Gammaproteobacteria bacterium]
MTTARKKNAPRSEKNSEATLAETSDRYELYEAAVQNVAEQCNFVDYMFKTIKGRKARSFREDFCGTASASCEWVRLGRKNVAMGVDIDREVLQWGREHRLSQLTKKQQQRVSLIHGDVMRARTEPVDVVGAFNFSYWIFDARPVLRRYFETVYRNLQPGGVFFLDAFGGYDAFRELKEKVKYDGFTYIWDQATYSPVTGRMQTHIHFKFPDGSRLKKAFSYGWRLWTLPEIQEILEEAGFRKSTVYFEYRDEYGEALGEWYPESKGEADSAWVANISAEK